MASIRKTREKVAKSFINSERHLLTTHLVEYVDEVLEPLNAAPTAWKLLRRAAKRNPTKVFKVFSAVYFGVPSSGQWRLVGEGRSEKLAENMVLRIAAGKKELSRQEREVLEGGVSAKELS